MMRSEHIKDYVNDYFKTDITSKTRDRELFIYPRQVYYALCRKFCEPEESGYSISQTIGKNHATRINGLKRFDDYYGQGFYEPFSVAFNTISGFIVDNDLINPAKRLKTAKQVELEYKMKIINLINQRQKVIANIKRKCALFEKNDVFHEVFDLPENELKEFEQLAKVFLKRKKRELECA